jgi:serine/threonine protein kinase
MYDFLEGLNFLHKNSIINRDVKPANSLMDRNGRIVLTDFGLSRHYGEPDRELTANVVTPDYRAPEIFG